MELVLLCLLILLGTGFLILRKSSSADSVLPRWSLPAWNEIRHIRIERQSAEGVPQSVELERRGSEWIILSLNRPAENSEMALLMQQLQLLQPVDLLAEKGPYSRFGLDPEQRTVLLLESEGRQDRFFVGRSVSQGNYSYLRRDDDPAVYAVKGDLSSLLNREAREYRSRQIFTFEDETAEALVFSQGEKINILTEFDEPRLISYLKRLSRLKCLSFTEKRTGEEESLLTLTIVTDRSRHTLFLLNGDGTSYTAAAEGQTDLFLLPRYDGDYLFELSGFGGVHGF